MVSYHSRRLQGTLHIQLVVPKLEQICIDVNAPLYCMTLQ